ncbi:Bro-N domain-containing protein [Streptomyces sp. ACA25]|uniref:BRO-N domain-containing protein n=1 Tax=Streptomyces sp. ACA25 TaxID=3022596 RepID=UPI0023078FFC|nr:Bro-N domain-containing protein [Streptomyces sp. ACA25]MDB1086210.1 Bro-N domain-containing protein [Streptomyces sp. ACA25]
MSEQQVLTDHAVQREAIDISDFVYAATGARVRRLTLPSGEHWFPAADICRQLGYVNTSDALRRHVPESMRCVVATLVSREALHISAGHGLRTSMVLMNLHGLIRLVNGCVKRECEPFKNWITEIAVTVQQEGSYSLRKAELQPSSPQPGTPPAYAVPQQLTEALVRLEESRLRSDEKAAAAQEEANQARWGATKAQQVAVLTQRQYARAMDDMVTAHQATARSMCRIAEALEELVSRGGIGASPARERPLPSAAASRAVRTADDLLAAWRSRLSAGEDVWAVAAFLAPVLMEEGEAGHSLAEIAEQTGLTQARVHDSLRFLLKRQAIRQTGISPEGAPVYVVRYEPCRP